MSSSAFSAFGILGFQIALTIFAWGMWGIFDKLALEKSEPKDVFLVTALLAIPQVPIVMLLLHWFQGQWTLSLDIFLLAGASTVVSSIGMALYLDAMKRADTSVVLGLTAGYPLVTQILALIFMGESFSSMRAAGAVLIAIGIVIIGLSDNLSPMIWQPSTALPDKEKDKEKYKDKDLNKDGDKNRDKDQNSGNKPKGAFSGLPVFAALIIVNLLWGVKGIFEKLSLGHGTPLEAYLSECITHLLLLGPVLLLFIMQGYKPKLKNRHLWQWTGLSELSLAIGGWSYLVALSMAPAGYVVTITSTYPLVMYVIAIFVLKEKFNWLRVLGMALIVGGGFLI